MKKTIIALLVAFLVFALFSCDNAAGPVISNAEETEADLVINSKEEFLEFAEEVKSGNTYFNKLVVLNSDIELSADEFIPVGEMERKYLDPSKPDYADGSRSFQGIFDGKDYTISYSVEDGKGILKDALTEEVFCGLFASTSDGAEIKNLYINANVSSQDINLGAFGGVVGFTSGNLILSDILVSGSISTYDSTAGLVGKAYGLKMKASDREEQGKTGFDLTVEVSGCANEADISVSRSGGKAAGFVAHAAYQVRLIVNDSVNTGNISSSGWASACLGGIAASTLEINDFRNLGEISPLDSKKHDDIEYYGFYSGSNESGNNWLRSKVIVNKIPLLVMIEK